MSTPSDNSTEAPAAATRKGWCLCHGVEFELTGESFLKNICHCDNCRRMSGATFLPIDFNKEDQFTITKGKDLIKAYENNDTASGDVLKSRFCSHCGSGLFATSAHYPGTVMVAAGALENVKDWAPAKESFTHKRWDFICDLKVPQSRP